MRPRIICHMISSVDGRLLPSRWTPLVDETRDNAKVVSERYEHIADTYTNAEGFIIGRKTMEEFNGVSASRPVDRIDEQSSRSHHVARASGQPVAVVVDPSGKLHYQAGTVDGGYHVVAILSEAVSDEYLNELRQTGVSYLFAGPKGDDMEHAAHTLHEAFGLNELLLEGGGTVNGSFLKARLIDEISLLIYPGIDGLASAPSIFDYQGQGDDHPAKGQALRHVSTQAVEGGFVWIRYLVEAV